MLAVVRIIENNKIVVCGNSKVITEQPSTMENAAPSFSEMRSTKGKNYHAATELGDIAERIGLKKHILKRKVAYIRIQKEFFGTSMLVDDCREACSRIFISNVSAQVPWP